MKLDFYYWASLCPLNDEMLALLAEYRDRLEVVCHDISAAPALAKEQRMFYPTLTVAEGGRRFFSPLSRGLLDGLCRGTIPRERPYRPVLGSRERGGTIVPLTAENCRLAGQCTGRPCSGGCENKAAFFRAQGLSVFGFLNLEGERLLGGAEYVPSLLVPYDIPKDDRTAFLTCVYLSDSEFDYKSPPLGALEEYLSQSYDRIFAVSDEKGVFPNGDLPFFLRNGYTDEGILAHEPGYCTLHLMRKSLI